MSEADAVTGVGNAVTAGLIAVSGEFVTICGFNEEWGGRAPMSSAEKQKAYRERQRGQVALPTVTEACDESNALPRREEKRGEENREEARAPRRKAKPIEVDLPEGWAPNDKHRELATKLGVDCLRESEQFVDRNASKGNRYADWNAAFRTWLRNAAEFRRSAQLRVVPANDERDRIRKIPDLGGRRS